MLYALHILLTIGGSGVIFKSFKIYLQITKFFDNGDIAITILLDLRKAFDK